MLKLYHIKRKKIKLLQFSTEIGSLRQLDFHLHIYLNFINHSLATIPITDNQRIEEFISLIFSVIFKTKIVPKDHPIGICKFLFINFLLNHIQNSYSLHSMIFRLKMYHIFLSISTTGGMLLKA